MMLNNVISNLKNSSAIVDPKNPNKVLFFGGWDEKRTLSSIIAFDITSQSSEVVQVLPYTVEGHTVTLVEDGSKKIFIIGGFNGIDVLNRITVMDEDGNFSDSISLETPRENHSTIFIKHLKQILILGGWDGTRALDTVERFELINEEPHIKRLETIYLSQGRQKGTAILF